MTSETGYDPEAGAVEYQAQVYFATTFDFDEDEVHDAEAHPSNWTDDNAAEAAPTMAQDETESTSTSHHASDQQQGSAHGDTHVVTSVEESWEISVVVTDAIIMCIAGVKMKTTRHHALKSCVVEWSLSVGTAPGCSDLEPAIGCQEAAVTLNLRVLWNGHWNREKDIRCGDQGIEVVLPRRCGVESGDTVLPALRHAWSYYKPYKVA
eukprot:3390166-Amphidinium_carterae.1